MIAAINTELPPFKNRKHNPESTSTTIRNRCGRKHKVELKRGTTDTKPNKLHTKPSLLLRTDVFARRLTFFVPEN